MRCCLWGGEGLHGASVNESCAILGMRYKLMAQVLCASNQYPPILPHRNLRGTYSAPTEKTPMS